MKKYPLEIIAVEREFQLFNVKKRFDVAVLNTTTAIYTHR